MKITLYATITANGFIADKNGNEDIFPDANWEFFKKLSLKHKNIIWGRKTYDMVSSWGEKYIKCFDNIDIIVLSKDKIDYNRKNVTVCQNISQVINIIKIKKILNPLVAGGTSIYTLFIKENMINKIILGYNSILIDSGINLLNSGTNISNFKIDSCKKYKKDILIIEMKK